MTRRPVIEALLGLGAPLGLLVALALAQARLGHLPPLLELASRLVWLVAALAAPVVFFRAFRGVFRPADSIPRRIGLLAGVALCTLAWYFVAYTLLVNFYLAFGGSL